MNNYTKYFLKLAALTPKEPTPQQEAFIGNVLNLYLDGANADWGGTHQGWSAPSDEAMGEICSALNLEEESLPVIETPDEYLNRAVWFMTQIGKV